MRYLKLSTILILVLNSCISKEVNEKELKCSTDTELIANFLIKEHGNILDFYELENFKLRNECFDFKNFTTDYDKLKENRYAFGDTLNHYLGLSTFKQLKEEDKEVELIRTIRITSGNIVVVEAQYSREISIIRSYELSFNDKCNMPLTNREDKLPFSKKCISIKKSSELIYSSKDRSKLRAIVADTDLKNIAYSQYKNYWFCTGSIYHLEYFLDSGVYPINRKYYLECPSKLSAIYLVSEELINLAKDGD